MNELRNIPFSVLLKVVGRHNGGGVCDVHLVAGVGVGSDENGAVLGIEGEVGDVDVTGCSEDASRLPVQSSVVVQQDSNPLKVRNQLFGTGQRKHITE